METARAKAPRNPLRNLVATQFLGAFNDNAWKLCVTYLAIRALRSSFVGTVAGFEEAVQVRTALAFSVLTLPLILFSLPGGVFSDRASKSRLILGTKYAELACMILATLGLLFFPANAWLPLLVLGLMGAQTAFFSPAKYGILPELVPHANLSSANAQIEMGSFVGIILGTALGGVFLDAVGTRAWLAPLFLTGFALVGVAAAKGIPVTPVSRTEGGLVHTLRYGWKSIRADRVLWLSVVGSVLFWLLASALGQNILVFAKAGLGLSDTISGFPLAVFGVGVGVGSLWAGHLSSGKVEYGLIPLGAVGMTAGCLILGFVPPSVPFLFLSMAVMGIASGFLIVPIQSSIQWRSPADGRGAVISLANLFTFAGVFVGSLSVSFLARNHLGTTDIFRVCAGALALGTLWALYLLPDALFRLVLVVLTHTVYRVRVMGREQVPETGGVLLVPNHVTWIDGLLILATTDRPVRFLVEQEYFEKPFAKPLMKMLGAIPILSTGGPRALLRAIRSAGDFLDRGEVVCIFPEGQISRTGGLLPFRRGFQRLAKNRKAQIVPVYLDRLWGSIFSRAGGRFLWKLPKRIPYPVTVAFGSPMENSTPIHVVRAAVQMLGVEAWRVREGESKSLPAGFIGQARHCPWAFAFADAERSRVSRGKALAGAVLLARKLRLFWGEEPHIGILLPPSVPGAIVNLAASMAGKTIVNLNYTSGSVGMASAISQACLHTVVTSRIFLERAKIEIPSGARPVYLEDLRPSSLISRGVTFAMALFAPQQTLFRFCGAARPPRTDDVATIIFSSGSTGDPKGVMLTHFNLRSNIEAVSQVMRTERSDRVLGILPFFHSFGFLTLWLSATEGVPMPMHPNPLEAAAIGNLVLKYRVTLLVATPTFLNLYLRRVTAEQFGSLRFVLTGAERLPDRLAMAFEDRFGLRPIEGYGTTECSPVVAASVPGFRAPGFYQAGERRGFVGHPLPCVAVRVVDPETFLPLPPNKPGLLLVAGANVMKGYLERDDLTRNVIRDGWYVTGDIAAVDENGFLKITDRLSRFAKIGGEMIPLVRVEEALHEAAAADTVRFAVTTIPDERKGEQLAVLHTVDESGLDELLAKLSATGLPNLFIPKRNRFFRVETLPMLGSGKLDLRALKEIAAERALDGTNPAST